MPSLPSFCALLAAVSVASAAAFAGAPLPQTSTPPTPPDAPAPQSPPPPAAVTAEAPSTPPAAAEPPAPPPALTVPVAVQVTSQPVDPRFQEFAGAFPSSPVLVNPISVQNAMSATSTISPTDTPLAAKIRAAFVQIAPGQRLDNEPDWRDSINPIFWLNRTQGGAADWWSAYKSAPADLRAQPGEVYPFVWDSGTEAPSPARAKARAFNNDGLDALFIRGDYKTAADLLYKGVTADPAYPYAPYNAGVLQMCLHNPEAAITMFLQCGRRAETPPALRERADFYRESNRKMILLLLSARGSQRRIYGEDIDAAWVLMNVGQYRAAVLYAGQAAAIDPDETRPEAHLLVALIAANRNRPADAVRWLQYAMERCKSPAAIKAVGGVLKEAAATAAAAAKTSTTAAAP